MKMFLSLFETIRADGKKAEVAGLRTDDACAGYRSNPVTNNSLCCEPRSSARFPAVQHRDDTGTKKLGLLVAKELELSVK